MLSFGATLPGWVVNGESVDVFSNVEVMPLWRLEPKGGITDLVAVVDGASFTPVGPGAKMVLDLLVWN